MECLHEKYRDGNNCDRSLPFQVLPCGIKEEEKKEYD